MRYLTLTCTFILPAGFRVLGLVLVAMPRFCGLPDCKTRCRSDGSCSSSSCLLYRPSKRTLVRAWMQKARAFLKTPSPTPVKKSCKKKIRRRLCSKQAPAPTPHSQPAIPITDFGSPSDAAAELPECPGATVISGNSSSSVSESIDDRETIKDAIMDACLVPEARFSSLNNFFKFGSMHNDDPQALKEGTFQRVVARVALEFPQVCTEVGEPRALAVYSNISGIFQKISPDSWFFPSRTYIAAIFYLGWELAGSWDSDSDGPAIIRSAPQKDVVAGVYTLINLMKH